MVPILTATNNNTHNFLNNNNSNNKQPCRNTNNTVLRIINKYKITSVGSTSNNMLHGLRQLPMVTIIHHPLIHPRRHRSRTNSRLNSRLNNNSLLGRTHPNKIRMQHSSNSNSKIIKDLIPTPHTLINNPITRSSSSSRVGRIPLLLQGRRTLPAFLPNRDRPFLINLRRRKLQQQHLPIKAVVSNSAASSAAKMMVVTRGQWTGNSNHSKKMVRQAATMRKLHPTTQVMILLQPQRPSLP
mmetsp:Transcript_9660/g.17148  ORF Transcript_9660/g.17148 Transcript_9660/m.17148 type:complete len:241 (-) Transcript_9660:848-1570(-)